MPRTRVFALGVAVALLVGACGGGGSDPTERDDEASSGASVTSEDEPTQDARTGASTTAADELRGAQQPAAAAPVRLGERFSWCAKVQALWDAQDEARAETAAAAMAHEVAVGIYEAATDDLDRAEASEAVDDAYAAYVLSTRDYGRARWDTAGLLLGDESVLLDRGQQDSTLQVAIQRARDAYHAAVTPHTLAALDLAHEATETAERLRGARLSVDDLPGQAVEAPEPEPDAVEASEAWFIAAEALQEAFEGVENADRALDDASAAAAGARAANNEAEDAASAIHRAARGDGEWEASIRDIQTHLAVSRSSAEAVEDFAMQALEAQAAAAAAVEAVRAAEEASAAARSLAQQSGATSGADVYRDLRSNAQFRGPAWFQADMSADLAAATASPASRWISKAADTVEDAAWHVARISADLDTSAVTAFKESLQQSCQ